MKFVDEKTSRFVNSAIIISSYKHKFTLIARILKANVHTYLKLEEGVYLRISHTLAQKKQFSCQSTGVKENRLNGLSLI